MSSTLSLFLESQQRFIGISGKVINVMRERGLSTSPQRTQKFIVHMERHQYYTENPRFYMAVDCVIFGFENGLLQVLLQKRDFEPFSGELSLQGGFVRENENLDDAAQRVLLERTGVENVYINQVRTFGNVDRDPGARVISTAYTCLINKKLCKDDVVEANYGQWVPLNELPPLHFGHDEMVRISLNQLRNNIGKKPVGFYLLPPMFTLTQLQTLHEAILDKTLDKRNFRKHVAEMPFIEKTGKIDKKHSKRGAALYQYNKEEFERINKFKL